MISFIRRQLLRLLMVNMICAFHLFALNPNKRITQYDIRIYQAKDGLPMNSLKKVFQDSRGYIWIGTQEGLVRFDGVQFKIYDKKEYPGLRCNFIWDIDEDADGILWLATHGGGISCFDGFKFTSYDTGDGLANNIARKIVVAKDNSIWMSTEDGVSHLINNRFINYTPVDGRDVFGIEALLEDQNGRLLVGGRSWVINIITNDSLTSLDIKSRTCSLYQKQSGTILLGHLWPAISCIKDDRVIPFDCGNHNQKSRKKVATGVLLENPIWDMLEDRDGNLWFCADGVGIIRFANGRFDSLTIENGLPGNNNYLISVMEDREGSLWFATEGGLAQLKDNKFVSYGMSEGFPSNWGLTVCEDESGNMWAGFRDAGISSFCRDLVRNFDHEKVVPLAICSVIPASSSGIWIGGEKFGIIRFFRNQIMQAIQDVPMAQKVVFSLFENKQQELWMGTAAMIHKYTNKKMTDYPFAPPPFSKFDVIAIAQSQNGVVWFGTRNAGLYKLTNDQITREGILPALLSDGINALYEDTEGSLWIGTDNLGLYRFKDGEYTNFSVHDGLFCDRLFSILEDDSAKLWFSTNKGVFCVKKQQLDDYARHKSDSLTCTVYNHLDGMREAECNGRKQPCAWRSRDGKLWFASIAGIVTIDPNHIPTNPVKPPVYIESIMSNDSTYRLTENPIRLRPSDRDIEFKYTALSFAIPERVRFKYRLEGYDHDWINAKTRRSAYYTNLLQGDYTFRVIACNNDGLWNKDGASIQFTIPPFWYERRMAYIAYGVLGLSLLVLVIRLQYRRKLTKEQLRLRAEHATKLEELDQAKSRFFAGISHEFRTPLTLIKGPLQDLLDESKTVEKRSVIDMMLRNTYRLERLVNQLLDLSKLQSGKLVLQACPVQLIKFIKLSMASFESYAKRENIKLKLMASNELDSLEIYLDPDKMEKALVNLISNALKYTDSGGTVEVAVLPPGSRINTDLAASVDIRITDTGCGIPRAELSRIFDYFYRFRDERTSRKDGTGIGLALTRELVKLHHGDISVISEEGVGSVFTISLPAGKAHLKPEEIASDALHHPDVEPGASNNAAVFGGEEANSEIAIEMPPAGAKSDLPIILLVEDNPDMRSYIAEMLDSEYRVIEAKDGGEGYQKAIAEIPDLVISDVMMPCMDGFEFCQKLKSNELTSHIPVILLTAKGSGESKLKGLELGAVDYLTKPFEKQELLLRIRNLIEFQHTLQVKLRKELPALDMQISDFPVTSADQRFLAKAMDVAEKNITDPDFNAQTFAREMALSRAHLNRKLRGLVGQRTNEFIRTLRLKRAAILIKQQFGTISEIAYEVGFNHLSYFARSFKEQYGVAPSEYGG
ncbi:response regulator [candidate division KSB1 bacterium]|nr:response regulator [candidate division KSB1 bacterium]